MARGQDVQFDQNFRSYFEADDGAYSIVSATEAGDGQVTLSGVEKQIVLAYFGANELDQYRGNAPAIIAKGLNPYREFRHFPSGEMVTPGLYYPKPGENELRLYFSNSSFKVSSNDYWGVFLRGNEIWLCSFSELLKSNVEQGLITAAGRGNILEPDDDNFQEQANGAPPGQVTSTQTKWQRDPKIAQDALEAQDYVCELFPAQPTFISRRSGRPFLEAHHLIPMREQSVFPNTLDTIDNICILNPYGHRMIHHAKFDIILPHLRSLIAARRPLLERHGLLEDDLLSLYR